MTRALLMSSSRKGASGYLEHAGDQLRRLYGEAAPRRALLIPYAAVAVSYDDYLRLATPAFAGLGIELDSIHRHDDPVAAVESAEAIAVAGGNTFALLHRLATAGLLDPIRTRVREHGVPYVGWSAGTNVATPSIRTTNDMPIVEPASFAALGLAPFQINPHFIPGKPAGHNGESREERLAEFTALHPDEEVLALVEGGALLVEGGEGTLLGDEPALVFGRDGRVRSIAPGTRFPLDAIRGPASASAAPAPATEAR